MAFSVSFYELIGVARDATLNEINRAANAKLKLTHPDVATEELKAVAHDRTVMLIEAKRILTDPLLRQQYDQTLVRPSKVPALCFLKHDWHETPSIDDLHPCGRILVCTRCNDRKADRVHQLGTSWHFYKDNSCEQARQCNRCHEYVQQFDMVSALTMVDMVVSNRPIPHFRWSAWTPVEGVCREMRRCERCGLTDSRMISHAFGDWAWVAEQFLCLQRRSCTRCGIVDLRERHDFSSQKRSIDTGARVVCCSVCGREKGAS